jgi:hypothetical protein
MPFRIAFMEEESTGWNIWDYISDGLFLFDVLV